MHISDQLIYAIRGIMEVSSGQNTWLIPPHFALWIPARTPSLTEESGVVAAMPHLPFSSGSIAAKMPVFGFWNSLS